jgi:hypothetical protein
MYYNVWLVVWDGPVSLCLLVPQYGYLTALTCGKVTILWNQQVQTDRIIPINKLLLLLFNCNWVDTRWHKYITHLHTNSTQNTEDRAHITIKKNKIEVNW